MTTYTQNGNKKKSSHESEDFLLHAIEQITKFAILH